MLHFTIEKQGRYDYDEWTTRVLTLLPAQGLLYLSEKDRPLQLYHRRLKLTEVRLWPTFSSRYVEEDFKGAAAKRSFYVKGLYDFTFDIAAAAAAESGGGAVVPGAVTVSSKREEFWMLRCASVEHLELLVDSFTKCILASGAGASSGGSDGVRIYGSIGQIVEEDNSPAGSV